MPMRTDDEADSINYLWMQGDSQSPITVIRVRAPLGGDEWPGVYCRSYRQKSRAKKKAAGSLQLPFDFGGLSRIRTLDLLIKSQLLYQLS
ncbi:hypothetical protein GLA29479_3151 [Lysobacter antibioticus]|nr:hypothetical protein GLA29479_3151 [Lysobacter antibioticus]